MQTHARPSQQSPSQHVNMTKTRYNATAKSDIFQLSATHRGSNPGPAEHDETKRITTQPQRSIFAPPRSSTQHPHLPK
jgi:hypothetical protein